MTVPTELEPWLSLVEQRLGLSCSRWQEERLAELVARWTREAGGVERPRWSALSEPQRRELMEQLTVGETYFFRDAAQLQVLTEVVLPERARVVGPGRPLRILSAGCSSGAEPYSIAIALLEAGAHAEHAEVHGFDLCPAAIQHASRARYSRWSLRAAPEPVLARFFGQDDEGYLLADEIRRRVTLEVRNLFSDDPAFWAPDAFDVIFCRNVFIYFSERAARATLERFAGALTPGGYLFLGASESARGLSDELELLNSGDAFYYRRRTPARRVLRSWERPVEDEPSAPAGDGAPWMEAIRRSLERLTALQGTATESAGGAAGAPPPPGAADVPGLRAQDRPAEAAAARIEARSAGEDAAPGPELVAAATLSENGRFAEAESICARLLGDRGGVAGAHYLLGLCREQDGSRARAAVHHREAVRLDPSFAMAHLRLGLLDRRAGDPAAARRALAQAAARLRNEPAERLSLFSGGFSREALLDLCLQELGALGGAL